MFPNLEIKNYRGIKRLKIESLGRVNLVVGKNNTCKTSLLEAVAMCANFKKPSWLNWIHDILVEHSEQRVSSLSVNALLEQLPLLCYGRILPATDKDAISIFGGTQSVVIRVVRLVSDERIVRSKNLFGEETEEVFLSTRVLEDTVNLSVENMFFWGIQATWLNSSQTVYLKENPFRKIRLFSDSSCRLIKQKRDNGVTLSPLWGKIALTDKEIWITSALNIIDANIEKLTFVDDERKNHRIPVVKIKSFDKPVALASMGDGINRILEIILSMVNIEANGCLLIDEFENGLHHTVQENLWRIIFKLSRELNIQVFATTHSADAVNSFASVVEELGEDEGKLIRLERDGEEIKAVEYPGKALFSAAKYGIETR